jgi:ATP-dependent Clp protease ATP-binding subunit ClpB
MGQRKMLSIYTSDKNEIEDFKYEAERAEREGDYGKVAEIRYGKKKSQERLDILNKELIENKLKALH